MDRFTHNRHKPLYSDSDSDDDSEAELRMFCGGSATPVKAGNHCSSTSTTKPSDKPPATNAVRPTLPLPPPNKENMMPVIKTQQNIHCNTSGVLVRGLRIGLRTEGGLRS